MKRSIILTLVALAAAAAFAQPMPPGGPMPGGPGRDPIASVLSLTADQKTAWEAAKRDFHTANQALFDKQRDTERQLHDALDAKSSDSCAIGALAVSLHATQEELETAHDGLRKKLESILTPEQRAKFESMPPRPPR